MVEILLELTDQIRSEICGAVGTNPGSAQDIIRGMNQNFSQYQGAGIYALEILLSLKFAEEFTADWSD